MFRVQAHLPLFEIANVIVRFYHIASFIVNAPRIAGSVPAVLLRPTSISTLCLFLRAF
jgi:hypothetical protein